MTDNIWDQRVIDSEIAFALALGGQAMCYDDLIHIHNPAVPWGGDFNRTLGVKLTDEEFWHAIFRRVEKLHRDLGLDPPDRFDLSPPSLAKQLWQPIFHRDGYTLRTATYMAVHTCDLDPMEDVSLVRPSAAQYRAWYR